MAGQLIKLMRNFCLSVNVFLVLLLNVSLLFSGKKMPFKLS